ncbi:MAG: hypothetical protein WC444_00250 [Candidatus Paceibacterota bacterium]
MRKIIHAAGISEDAILLALSHESGKDLAGIKEMLIKDGYGCNISHLARLRDSLKRKGLIDVVGDINHYLSHEGEFRVARLLAEAIQSKESAVA